MIVGGVEGAGHWTTEITHSMCSIYFNRSTWLKSETYSVHNYNCVIEAEHKVEGKCSHHKNSPCILFYRSFGVSSQSMNFKAALASFYPPLSSHLNISLLLTAEHSMSIAARSMPPLCHLPMCFQYAWIGGMLSGFLFMISFSSPSHHPSFWEFN